MSEKQQILSFVEQISILSDDAKDLYIGRPEQLKPKMFVIGHNHFNKSRLNL